MTKIIEYIFVFTSVFGALNTLFAGGENLKKENASSEFDIFNGKDDLKSAKTNTSSGIQMDIVVQKPFARDSIFFPDRDFMAMDNWIFTQFLRFTQKPKISETMSINLDFGLKSTTESKKQALNEMNKYFPVSGLMNSVHPMFENELSFLHFFIYDFSVNLSFLPTDTGTFFLTAGILPVKSGNSFYKNPVSFFERYLAPKNYLQEYSPLSFPAIKLDYIFNIYHLEILFVPEIAKSNLDKNSELSNISRYLYFTNYSNILSVKNSLDFSDIITDVYFFWENKPEKEIQNHFGFGHETSWRVFKDLHLNWQMLISNGKPDYEVSTHSILNSTYYSFEARKNSTEDYHLESLVSINFSGLDDFETSFGYYFNGYGLSGKQYRELHNALEISKKGYASSGAILKSLHMLFFASVLTQFDLFSMNQHYVFMNIASLQNMEFFSWGFSTFIALEQFALMPILFANFNVNTQTKVYFQLMANFGETGSVFSESPTAGSINGGIQFVF